MGDIKCVFSAPLITRHSGCALAREVTRRGGPEIACSDEAAQQACAQLFEHLKAAALPAFGVEDDLLSMPHSVQVKIQHGGLLGLQRLLAAGAAGNGRISDIHQLVTAARQHYGELSAIPLGAIVPDITAFKTRTRRS